MGASMRPNSRPPRLHDAGERPRAAQVHLVRAQGVHRAADADGLAAGEPRARGVRPPAVEPEPEGRLEQRLDVLRLRARVRDLHLDRRRGAEVEARGNGDPFEPRWTAVSIRRREEPRHPARPSRRRPASTTAAARLPRGRGGLAGGAARRRGGSSRGEWRARWSRRQDLARGLALHLVAMDQRRLPEPPGQRALDHRRREQRLRRAWPAASSGRRSSPPSSRAPRPRRGWRRWRRRRGPATTPAQSRRPARGPRRRAGRAGPGGRAPAGPPPRRRARPRARARAGRESTRGRETGRIIPAAACCGRGRRRRGRSPRPRSPRARSGRRTPARGR